MKSNKFKVIQITDCHLFKDDSLMREVPTFATFNAVIDRIKKEELEDTDAIFLTGDISQDETKESYQRIVAALKDLNKKIYWIPGNHDSIETATPIFEEYPSFVRANYFNIADWSFIFLNTKKDGTDSGFLPEYELENLQKSLEKNKDKSLAIVMHHHPAAFGTPLLDSCMLMNPDPFWEILAKYPVKLIICGHVHNDYSFKYNESIMIEAAPATCIQFPKGAAELKFENKIGYKTYYFEKNNYVAKAVLWDR